MAESVQRHPLDFDVLVKGQTLTTEECEQATSLLASHPRFPIALLQLKGQIERELAKRGQIVTVQVDNKTKTLRILDDREAAPYNRRQFRLGMRRMARSHARGAGVDRLALPDAERREHNEGLLFQGMILTAVSQSRRQFRLTHLANPPKALTGGSDN